MLAVVAVLAVGRLFLAVRHPFAGAWQIARYSHCHSGWFETQSCREAQQTVVKLAKDGIVPQFREDRPRNLLREEQRIVSQDCIAKYTQAG